MKHIVKVNEEGLALLKAASMVIEIIWSEDKGTKKVVQAVFVEKMSRRRGKRLKYGRNPFLRSGKTPAEGNERPGAVAARLLTKYLNENKLKMVSRGEFNKTLLAGGRSQPVCSRMIKQGLDKGWIEAME